MKKYLTLFFACLASALATLFITNYRTQSLDVVKEVNIQNNKSIDSLQNIADSTYALLFPCEIQVNRFEIALQILRERNPKAAEQYSTIISEETE